MENSNKSNIIYIILAVVIVVAIAYVVYSSPAVSTPNNQTGVVNTGTTGGSGGAATATKDLTKAQILSLISSGKALTPEQKRSIFQSLVGDKLKNFNFTEKERQAIIQALNK